MGVVIAHRISSESNVVGIDEGRGDAICRYHGDLAQLRHRCSTPARPIHEGQSPGMGQGATTDTRPLHPGGRDRADVPATSERMVGGGSALSLRPRAGVGGGLDDSGRFRSFPALVLLGLPVHLADGRARRDEKKCAAKYGSDWNRYIEQVPWRVLPGLY